MPKDFTNQGAAAPEPPDLERLVRSNGQALHTINFWKGEKTRAYIRLRLWCWQNELNFSDIINGIIEGVDHYCQNFAREDRDGNVVVTINLGDITLRRIRRPHALTTKGRRHILNDTEQVMKDRYNETRRKDTRVKHHLI